MLRVVSLNVRNGRALDGCNSWPFRRRALVRLLHDLAPDIAALQEVYRFQQRYLARHLSDLDFAGAGRGPRPGRGERCPVATRRTRVEVVSATTRWFGDDERPHTLLPGARFPRVATVAVVETQGARVGVVSTHLDERDAANRERSVALLAGWLDPSLPWIVAGDFNAPPDDPVLSPLLAAGLRHVLPPDAPGTAHGFTGRTDRPRIDHVLVSEAFEVRAAWVSTERPDGRYASDHWPVVADLHLWPGS